MTTEEFIEAVNAIDNRDGIKAYVEDNGDIFLRTNADIAVAGLEKYGINWDIRTMSQVTFPTKILKLMVELAESREDDNRYVILNGKPFLDDGNISIRIFLIIDASLDSTIVSIDDLNSFYYTKEELERFKSTLPEKLQDAVDMLTVTVSEAKKVLKNDD